MSSRRPSPTSRTAVPVASRPQIRRKRGRRHRRLLDSKPPPLPEIRHRVLSPPSLNVPPPGWTVELDRREELTALSELTLNRKC